MPAKLAALLYPVMLGAFALGAAKTSPTARFAKAGAFSPETARRPSSLGVPALAPLKDLVRDGVLVRLDDGRYYLNRTVHRKRQLTTAALLAVILSLPFALFFWVLASRGLL